MPEPIAHLFDLSISDELDAVADVRFPDVQEPRHRPRPSVHIWSDGKWAPAEYPAPRRPGRRRERPSARWAKLAIRRNMRRSGSDEQPRRMILQVANEQGENVEVVITRARGERARISARHGSD